MSRGGFYQMARGWMDDEFFTNEPFSERDAWCWLIEHAAWKPTRARIRGATVELDRGEMTFSVRFLADRWQWSKSRVDRFLCRLASENMVKTRSKIGTVTGRKAGQSQSIITICNYEKYQSPLDCERDSDEKKSGQQRDKEEEGKEIRKENNNRADGAAPLAFDGRVIRLKQSDFDRWHAAYPAIDLMAALQSRDDWLWHEADEKLRKRWFIPTSNYLANLQSKAKAAEKEAEWWSPC